MEPYSNTSFSSYPKEENKPKRQPSFLSSLHSVRKPPAKPMKKPIAPLPPTPPKVYKVNSINFKAVVQKLTSEPEFLSRRLHDLAPPPLNISTTTTPPPPPPPLHHLQTGEKTPLSATFRELMNETLETKTSKLWESLGALSPLGFILSPASLAWCSLALMSPGTLSPFGQGTVLWALQFRK